MHQQQRKDRWRLVASGAHTENDFEMEQVVRNTVLEASTLSGAWIQPTGNLL